MYPQDLPQSAPARARFPWSSPRPHTLARLIVAVQGKKQQKFTLKLPGQRCIRSEADSPELTSFSPRQLWREALLQAYRGRYSQAIATLTQLIQIDPDHAIYYNNRGLFYFRNQQPHQALADYNRALQLNPQLSEAYNNRANYYAYQGQLEPALADYNQALQLNPLDSRAWINRGITYRHLKQYTLALKQFEVALQLGRLQGHIFAERGRTHHLIGDWNRAVGDYQQALAVLATTGSALSYPDQRQRQRVKSWLNELLQPLVSSPQR